MPDFAFSFQDLAIDFDDQLGMISETRADQPDERSSSGALATTVWTSEVQDPGQIFLSRCLLERPVHHQSGYTCDHRGHLRSA